MILFLWAGYALAGAGVIEHLPLTKLALTAICVVYLGRAVAFPSQAGVSCQHADFLAGVIWHMPGDWADSPGWCH
jgi:Flp pilus assembly secretin CpaC